MGCPYTKLQLINLQKKCLSIVNFPDETYYKALFK